MDSILDITKGLPVAFFVTGADLGVSYQRDSTTIWRLDECVSFLFFLSHHRAHVAWGHTGGC